MLSSLDDLDLSDFKIVLRSIRSFSIRRESILSASLAFDSFVDNEFGGNGCGGAFGEMTGVLYNKKNIKLICTPNGANIEESG